MKLKNPFRLNDWDIKSFLVIVLSIQLAYLGAVGLDKLSIQIPFLRQILGFIYLTFIPGYLLLRILKIHNLSSEESFLYAIGLSLFFDMFVGFLMNVFYPLFGITSRPISEIPIIVTLVIATSLLSVWAYFRDKEYYNSDFINSSDILSPQFLFFSLIPFMAVFGTYLVNYYDDNTLLMGMIAIIALVILLIIVDVISARLYPYIIWSIALSLILHTTLISNYIIINDNVGEYYVAKLVIANKFWNMGYVYNNYNSVMSVTMLAPTYFYFCNLDLTWIYKLIYPLIYSFVPVGVYIFSLYITKDKKISFLSSFLMISMSPFFIKIPTITKQAIGEVFLILLLIVLFTHNNAKIQDTSKTLLRIFFGISLIVSHYGVAYLVLGMLVFILVFSHFQIRSARPTIYSKNFVNSHLAGFVTLYFLFMFIWYFSVSESSVFRSITIIGKNTIILGLSQLVGNHPSRAIYTLSKQLPSMLWYIYRWIYLFISISAAIGVILMVIYKKLQVCRPYKISLVYWTILLGVSLFVPTFTSGLDLERIFHITFLTLSLPSIICFFEVSRKLNISAKIFVSIILIMMLLFNTQFIFEITKDNPTSISISQKTMEHGNINSKSKLYWSIIYTQDIFSSRWLNINIPTSNNGQVEICRFDIKVGYPALIIYGGFIPEKIKIINLNNNISNINSYHHCYFQLTYANVIGKVGWIVDFIRGRIPFSFNSVYYMLLYNKSKIYDNGGSQVLWVS